MHQLRWDNLALLFYRSDFSWFSLKLIRDLMKKAIIIKPLVLNEAQLSKTKQTQESNTLDLFAENKFLKRKRYNKITGNNPNLRPISIQVSCRL